MAIDYRKLVLSAPFPEGFQGTTTEYEENLVSRLRVMLSEEGGTTGSLQFGGVSPGSDHSVIWIDRTDPSRPQLKIWIDRSEGNPSQSRDEYGLPYYIPIGMMLPFAGTRVDHPDWIECDNRKLTVAQYPELYAAIGNLWGGTANVDFYAPDMRGRVPIGADGSGAETSQVGSGTDYAGDKGKLKERPMLGSSGPGADGAEDAEGNHPGYPGHDFAFNTTPASPNRPKKPKGQYKNLDPVDAAGKILSCVQPSTTLRWFIKAR